MQAKIINQGQTVTIGHIAVWSPGTSKIVQISTVEKRPFAEVCMDNGKMLILLWKDMESFGLDPNITAVEITDEWFRYDHHAAQTEPRYCASILVVPMPTAKENAESLVLFTSPPKGKKNESP